jgi:hypothetical protein
MSELYERSQWINQDFDYQFGSKIIEYDMKSAGLSLIKEYKLLPQEKIDELDSIKDKKTLNVKVGCLCRDDKDFNAKFQECFKLARQRFFEANILDERCIVSIKRDAIFVMGRECENTQFGYITFIPKHEYTSYIRIKKNEFYINTKTHTVDVKGLGQGETLEQIQKAHKDGIFELILRFARAMELNDDRVGVMMKIFITAYRNLEQRVEYYRELNQSNAYRVYDEVLDDWVYRTDIDSSALPNIDITYNYFNIIVPLASIVI